MHWSLKNFELLYNSIENGNLDSKLFDDLLDDLKNLNLNNDFMKNAASRSTLENGKIKLANGSEYSVAQAFIIAAIKLSDELNLDEIVACELMLSSIEDSNLSKNDDLLLLNNGKIQYYMRRQYILQIVSYVVNCLNSNAVIFQKLINNDDKNTFIKTTLLSFKAIHTQLEAIKQIINKAQILEQYDVLFQQNIKFRYDFLLKEYDTLSQILYGLADKKMLLTKDHILSVIDHICELDTDDVFLVYYIPTLFNAFNRLDDFAEENDVRFLHKTFLSDLENEDKISKNPVKVMLIFTFLTCFISWCKQKPFERAKNIDFKTAIDDPMSLAVEYGALEQLMVISADTSKIRKDKSVDLFYDIRSLLQRHFPKLIPKQLIDNERTYDKIGQSNDLTNNYNGNLVVNTNPYTKMSENIRTKKRSKPFLSQYEVLNLSTQTEGFLLTSMHAVLQKIITDCAFLLTKIKDAEEDSLLSGEDLDLDDVSTKADLERFFLTVYFFYASRPEYSKEFWQDKESNAYGFIEWSSKCSDSLMRSCFYLMISSLSYGSENALNVFHYFKENSIVSWNIIAQSISDYIIKINNYNKTVQNKHQSLDTVESNITMLALEEGLSEETIIFLSSLFTLIGSVAHDVDNQTKLLISNTFSDILFEFAKLDTPLMGACLTTLSHIVPNDNIAKVKFWRSLDSFIFQNVSLQNNGRSYRRAFSSVFTSFTEVLGFLLLFNKLLSVSKRNSCDEFLEFGTLEFPTRLGQGYRKVGIWPYFDYIFNDIFVPSGNLNKDEDRMIIQTYILEIINTALCSFDYRVILDSVPTSADLNKLVITEDFYSYTQENPATAVFNYLFTEKAYQGLFSIADIGIDELSGEEVGNEKLTLIENLMILISRILDYQESYLEEMVPLLRRNYKDIYWIPKDFGPHGLRSFYDAIFFNLNVIAHFGLYVGIDKYNVASKAVSILNRLSIQFTISDIQGGTRSKLLTIFDAVDESARIKDAFISQIETPIDTEDRLKIKIDILEFLNSNLSYNDKTMNVVHFLLGFKVDGIISAGPKLATFLNSNVSLFNSLLYLLQASLQSINPANVQYAPIRLASLAIEILLKLTRNTLTSNIIFKILLDHKYFELITKLDPQITNYTLWSGEVYNPNSSEDVKSFINGPSIGALMSFLQYRSCLVQHLSFFIHRVSAIGTRSQINSYITTLISSTMYSARIFSFLDVLGFGYMPLDKKLLQSISELSNISLDLTKVTLKKSCEGNIYDMKQIDALFSLYEKAHKPPNNSTSLTTLESKPSDYESKLHNESVCIRQYVVNYLSSTKMSELLLSILHSWVQLVQILVLDGKLEPLERSNFILEVFSTIVPKINDYVEFDVKFSEELVSLAVFLYDVYNKDRSSMNDQGTLDTRLFNLFKVCIHGITSPMSSVLLRSDFYILANQYLIRILNDPKMSKEALQSLRIQNEKFVEAICNDAISGEATSRITAILLLDSLVQIANWNKENIILESLMKNTNLQLIIRSLKNVGKLLNPELERLDLDKLLYEITAFKSIIMLLIRIAETRSGSQSLVKNKLLQILNECNFLMVDPELGITVNLDDHTKNVSSTLKIGLDESIQGHNDPNMLSICELAVPVFKLISTILISVGSQNRSVINGIKSLLISYRKLLIGVFKCESLQGGHSLNKNKDLEELTKMIVILCSLTNYQGEESLLIPQRN